MGRKPKKFPKRPRLALIAKWINNSEVARALGVSEGMVWGIRRGARVADTAIGRKVRAELSRLSEKTVGEIWPGMEP